MKDITLSVAARSDVGRVRTNNEDAYTVTDFATGTRIESSSNEAVFGATERGTLLAVSDGMGGHQSGEVASNLVLEVLRDALPNESSESFEQRLEGAVRRANSAVFDASHAQKKQGMGATLTAVLINGADACIAEVGDSRAYLLRDDRLRQLTRDQSLVQLLVEGKIISPEDAKVSPQKNVILQAMGLAADVDVAVAKLHLRRGDKLLLCCDGISNALSDVELAQILTDHEPTPACARIIDLANERGGEDNLTAVVCQCEGDGLELPVSGPNPTGTFQVIHEFGEKLGAKPDAPAPAAAPPPVSEPAAPAAIPPISTATPSMPRGSSGNARNALLVAAVLIALAVVLRLLMH